jgi:pre-mRNA-splicing factor ATP-dependent RNA helicase DHX16
MSSDPIVTWCSDALHDLLGFTDAALASYLVAVARRKGTSNASLYQELTNGGVPVSQNAQAFSQQLYDKCAIMKQSSSKTSTRKSNADWLQDAAHYRLLDDDLDDAGGQSVETKTASSSSEKKSKKDKKKRRRRYDDDESDEDDPTTIQRPEHRRRRQEQQEESKVTREEQEELERERDLKERDEFVQRMLDRDKAKTEKKQEEVREKHLKQVEIEQLLAKGEKVVTEDGQELTLDKLREQSRRAYLKKREERELKLLEQELEEEDELFKGVKLTKAEEERRQLRREVLRMAKGEQDEDKNDGFYRLPDEYSEKTSKLEQDHALLTARYVETKGEKTEQELWEESQTLKAAGIPTKKKKKKDEEEQKYDLVFEDQIDFVVQDRSRGYDHRDEKHRRRQQEEEQKVKPEEAIKSVTEHEKILAGRKKLPVYAYREEFLSAIKEHQVLILVGETGSGKVSSYISSFATANSPPFN